MFLARAWLIADLAADRAVDHREQRRRDHHPVDAAHPRWRPRSRRGRRRRRRRAPPPGRRARAAPPGRRRRRLSSVARLLKRSPSGTRHVCSSPRPRSDGSRRLAVALPDASARHHDRAPAPQRRRAGRAAAARARGPPTRRSGGLRARPGSPAWPGSIAPRPRARPPLAQPARAARRRVARGPRGRPWSAACAARGRRATPGAKRPRWIGGRALAAPVDGLVARGALALGDPRAQPGRPLLESAQPLAHGGGLPPPVVLAPAAGGGLALALALGDRLRVGRRPREPSPRPSARRTGGRARGRRWCRRAPALRAGACTASSAAAAHALAAKTRATSPRARLVNGMRRDMETSPFRESERERRPARLKRTLSTAAPPASSDKRASGRLAVSSSRDDPWLSPVPVRRVLALLRRLPAARVRAAGDRPRRLPPEGPRGVDPRGRRAGASSGSRWRSPSTPASTSSCAGASPRTRGSWRSRASIPTRPRSQTALEFLAGYVVEYSLSVDNIFVFVVVMGYFAVPAAYQHRVLFFGILGALVFRAHLHRARARCCCASSGWCGCSARSWW